MPRRRRRNRGRTRWRSTLVALALAVVVAFVAGGVPGVALNTGIADRPASIDVVKDINGAQKLNVTTELEAGSDNCLVTVTNHLGQDVTVNVSLRGDSREYGDLKADLASTLVSGDSVEFDLAEGESQTVRMDVNSGTAGNTTYFHVRSTGSGLYAETLNRSAPIVSTADTTCA